MIAVPLAVLAIDTARAICERVSTRTPFVEDDLVAAVRADHPDVPAAALVAIVHYVARTLLLPIPFDALDSAVTRGRITEVEAGEVEGYLDATYFSGDTTEEDRLRLTVEYFRTKQKRTA